MRARDLLSLEMEFSSAGEARAVEVAVKKVVCASATTSPESPPQVVQAICKGRMSILVCYLSS